MPIYRKKNNIKKYLIMAIIIALLVLMFISFAPNPELTEIVLF